MMGCDFMFAANVLDWILPIGLGLLAGVLIATRKHHDYAKITTLSAEEFRQNMRKGQLIDLRPEKAHAVRRINGSRNFPKTSLFANLHKIRRDLPVFLYDEKPGATERNVARKLTRKGYKPVYVLQDGFAAWPYSVKEE